MTIEINKNTIDNTIITKIEYSHKFTYVVSCDREKRKQMMRWNLNEAVKICSSLDMRRANVILTAFVLGIKTR